MMKPIVEKFRDTATVQHQRARDAEVSLADVDARLAAVERLLGLRNDVRVDAGIVGDSAPNLDGVQAAKKARAHADSIAALNRRNEAFWEAERARNEKRGA